MQRDEKKQRSRPDRKAKLLQRKELVETVVKCSLRGVLIGDEAVKDRLVAAIRQRVVSYSRRAVLATRALGLLARRLLRDGSGAALDIIDQTTLRQLMLGTKACPRVLPHIRAFFRDRPDLLHDVSDRTHADRNIYSAAAIKLGTNIRTHLKENLLRIVKRCVYGFAPGTKDEQTKVLYGICGWPWSRLPAPKKPRKNAAKDKKCSKDGEPGEDTEVALSADQSTFVAECRRVLGLHGDQKVDQRWLDAKPNVPAMLEFFAFCLRKLEARGDEKLFALLPLCKRKRHFITVDTHVLHGIALDSDIIAEECSGDAFTTNGEAHWASLLNFHRLLPKGGRFTGTIETDGVAVCIHFQRPKKPGDAAAGAAGKKAKKKTPSRPDQGIIDSSRVIAIDPGRTNILFAAEVLPDGSVETSRLTRLQYYREAGLTSGQLQTERWQDGIRADLHALSTTSHKGVNVEKFEEFLAVDLSVGDSLWGEYLKPRWSQQRFRQYGGKKRVIARYFNKFEQAGKKRGDDRSVLVAYGAATLAPGGKGEVSVPTSQVFKACCQRFQTYPVDEFRTTRVCHLDDSVLEKVGVAQEEEDESGRRSRGVRAVRGLLWWRSTKQDGSKLPPPARSHCEFVNRDLNGAMNIRRCFMLPERPAMLDRGACWRQKLPDVIGCMIPR